MSCCGQTVWPVRFELWLGSGSDGSSFSLFDRVPCEQQPLLVVCILPSSNIVLSGKAVGCLGFNFRQVPMLLLVFLEVILILSLCGVFVPQLPGAMLVQFLGGS